MNHSITLIELLTHIVVDKNKSVEEAITFCTPLFPDAKQEMNNFERGWLDGEQENGVTQSDEYYLAGYRSWK